MPLCAFAPEAVRPPARFGVGVGIGIDIDPPHPFASLRSAELLRGVLTGLSATGLAPTSG